MDPREADLYGPRVLDLLAAGEEDAVREVRGRRSPSPVIVEIFPQKKEFAVRTFGLPGADGLLGVCFGRVITANSPASQGEHPSNWEAVLWHEFCHVVTLSKTHNKMPRWLSEGISVYEEEKQDPAWGQRDEPAVPRDDPGRRADPAEPAQLGVPGPEVGAPPPVRLLTSRPWPSSSWSRRSGLPALKGVLDDLGAGMTINEALPRRTKMSLDQLDRGVRRVRPRDGPKPSPPGRPGRSPSCRPTPIRRRSRPGSRSIPRASRACRRLAARLVAEEEVAAGQGRSAKLKALYPGVRRAGERLHAAGRRLQADVRPGRANTRSSRSWRRATATPSPAYLRLMELDEAAGDWHGVAKNARRLLAVNPLIPAPHRQLARAAEQLGERDEAMTAYRALAMLDDTDPAEVHYRLAKLLRQAGKPDEARREVLKSLEEAPRFLDAHRLLLELVEPDKPPDRAPPDPIPDPRGTDP